MRGESSDASHDAELIRAARSDPSAFGALYGRGCNPGFFFTWPDRNWGALLRGTEPGDRIRVWVVEVDGRRLFFVAETKEGFNHPLRPPPSKAELQRANREITKIVESIRFD